MLSVIHHIYNTKLEIHWDDGRCYWWIWEPSSYSLWLQGSKASDCHSHQAENQTRVCHAENWIALCFHEVTWIHFFVFPHLSNPSLDVILLECVLKWHNWQEILSQADVRTRVSGAFCGDVRLTSRHEWQMTLACKPMLNTDELGHTGLIQPPTSYTEMNTLQLTEIKHQVLNLIFFLTNKIYYCHD